MRRRPWRMLAAVVPLLTVAVGCGSGSTTTAPPAKPDFLYAITLSGQPPNITFNLSSFKLDDSTGLLSWTETIALPQPTLGLAVDPGARFLYVSSPNLLLPSIDTYSINASTGVPTHANTFLLTAVCAFCPLQSAPGALCA